MWIRHAKNFLTQNPHPRTTSNLQKKKAVFEHSYRKNTQAFAFISDKATGIKSNALGVFNC